MYIYIFMVDSIVCSNQAITTLFRGKINISITQSIIFSRNINYLHKLTAFSDYVYFYWEMLNIILMMNLL